MLLESTGLSGGLHTACSYQMPCLLSVHFWLATLGYRRFVLVKHYWNKLLRWNLQKLVCRCQKNTSNKGIYNLKLLQCICEGSQSPQVVFLWEEFNLGLVWPLIQEGSSLETAVFNDADRLIFALQTSSCVTLHFNSKVSGAQSPLHWPDEPWWAMSQTISRFVTMLHQTPPALNVDDSDCPAVQRKVILVSCGRLLYRKYSQKGLMWWAKHGLSFTIIYVLFKTRNEGGEVKEPRWEKWYNHKMWNEY